MLVDDNGAFLARMADTGDADILGSWRWWVKPFYRTDNTGSAQTMADARHAAEERLKAQSPEE